jgi:hypothetical protein
MSSDICDKDWEKRDYARSISWMNTVRFRPVQALSKSNTLCSVLLYYNMKKLVASNELWDATYIAWGIAL